VAQRRDLNTNLDSPVLHRLRFNLRQQRPVPSKTQTHRTPLPVRNPIPFALRKIRGVSAAHNPASKTRPLVSVCTSHIYTCVSVYHVFAYEFAAYVSSSVGWAELCDGLYGATALR
jgi:hypothetical protein